MRSLRVHTSGMLWLLAELSLAIAAYVRAVKYNYMIHGCVKQLSIYTAV
jgi:hypothetical protein